MGRKGIRQQPLETPYGIAATVDARLTDTQPSNYRLPKRHHGAAPSFDDSEIAPGNEPQISRQELSLLDT